MAEKITEVDVTRVLRLANMEPADAADPVGRALEARRALLRWADGPVDMFASKALFAFVQSEAERWRS